MIAPHRKEVIANIQAACEKGDFHAKVEIDDPVYIENERTYMLNHYMKVRKSPYFKILNWIAGRTLDVITWYWNRNTEIVGMENLKGLNESAIITSNHFNPSENTTIRLLSQKMKKGNLHVVSQDTNLALKGKVGFYMNYIDIIPISRSVSYMKNYFPKLMEEAIQKGQNILIYPEEEMWFNYRKPRPPKRGAYYYAALFHVPIVSCFVEMVDLPEWETENFHRVKYILHVLPVIYPDATLKVKDDSLRMMEIDYKQKVQAYEEAYHKILSYDFSLSDIAGYDEQSKEGI